MSITNIIKFLYILKQKKKNFKNIKERSIYNKLNLFVIYYYLHNFNLKKLSSNCYDDYFFG